MSKNPESPSEAVSRRSFVNGLLGGAGALSAGAIAGTVGMVLAGEERPTRIGVDHSAHSAVPSPEDGPSPASEITPAEMDAHHKQGVEDFLKNQKTPLTKGKGNQPLEPVVGNGVKVFRLTCEAVKWEVSPGKVFDALGYNGVVPGPILRATEGDRVRVVVHNKLRESTSIHWHGLYVPNNMDGVPYINQEPIKPETTFTYEFTLRNPGTHMYHSHHNAMFQVNRGLLGAFIVDPKDKSAYPQYDREHVMVLNDLGLGFTINGKGFPATDAVVAKKGERVLVRFLNEGVMNHPMHLHGMPMQIVAKDGWPMSPPQMCDTVDVAPGNRYDAIIEATEEGVWAFHCHVLSHAESEMGMFGLVTAMVVEA